MDLIQNGESSRSPSPHPHPNGTTTPPRTQIKPESKATPVEKARLILPEWDIPPEKHLHPSLDLISLLHLDSLYNTFVRPYADAEEDDLPGSGAGAGQGGGGGKAKKRRLEKGYQGLIEDCIDPTPLGEKRDHQSLLPLISDMMIPPGPPPNIWSDDIQLLPLEIFQVAKLESGTKLEGYGGGEKAGVREAEEKRRRKKARHSHSMAPELPSPAFPSPTTESLNEQLAPVAPPNRSYPVNHARRPSFASGVRPFPGSGGGRGGARPAQSLPPRPQMGLGDRVPSKRPLDGGSGGKQKRVKMGTASRSASPAGPAPGLGPRPPQSGNRSRTEGI